MTMKTSSCQCNDTTRAIIIRKIIHVAVNVMHVYAMYQLQSLIVFKKYILVESAYGERDIVVTIFVRCMLVCACIHPNLSGP